MTAENFNNFLFLQVDRQILLDDNFFTIRARFFWREKMMMMRSAPARNKLVLSLSLTLLKWLYNAERGKKTHRAARKMLKSSNAT